MNPNYPIYIVSKNRSKNGLTYKALQYMKVPYYIVVEENEYMEYKESIDLNYGNVLILPQRYLDEYDTFWPRAKDNKTGPGPARNFAWDHSIKNGHEWHWVMDDNLDAFHRLNRNEKWEVSSGTIFKIMEDFCSRYKNIAMAGPNYYSFVKKTDSVNPIIFNTRIYSCNLIKNDIPYRWRGRYNEDTDLSLRILKDGLCTVQFNAFLQGKVTTQRMKGGNTEEFYSKEGTYDKSKMLEDMHQDVAKVVVRFGRWHHYVDYRKFRWNILEFKDDIILEKKINNYGMVLKKKEC